MHHSIKPLLHWLPRFLTVIFILFISMFALDVFGAYTTVGETLLALFMHLIPSFLLIAAAAIAWRWRAFGGLLFIALGLISIVYYHTYTDLMRFGLISLPALVIGVLFLCDAYITPAQPKTA